MSTRLPGRSDQSGGRGQEGDEEAVRRQVVNERGRNRGDNGRCRSERLRPGHALVTSLVTSLPGWTARGAPGVASGVGRKRCLLGAHRRSQRRRLSKRPGPPRGQRSTGPPGGQRSTGPPGAQGRARCSPGRATWYPERMSRAASDDLPNLPAARFVQLSRGPLCVLDVAASACSSPVADNAVTPGRHRRPVLFVPGFTGSKEDFGPLLAPLARAGYRCIAYDQRGQWRSPGVGDPDGYTIERLASELAELVDALDARPVHLVGHSLGGLVARAAVIASPGLAASLTLLDSGPRALDGPRATAIRALAPLLVDHGLPAVWNILEATSADGPPSEFTRQRFLAADPAAVLGMGEALLSEPDRTAELAGTLTGHRVPALVAFGADDDAWPVEVQREMAVRLGARCVAIPGAAHSPAVESPTETLSILQDFLGDAEPTRATPTVTGAPDGAEGGPAG